MAHHLGEIVLGDGIGQAGGDYLQRHPFLLGGSDRLSHKGGAPCAQVYGVGGGKSQAGEVPVIHGNAEHFRQLINEAAGAGSAGLVHLVVNDYPVPLDNQLGVLPADFNNIGFRVYLHSGPGLGGNFVLHQVGPDEAAHQIPAGAGNTHAGYINLVRAVEQQIPEDLPHSVHRPPRRHQIVLGQDFRARLIKYHRLGAGRADVNAEIARTRLIYPLLCPVPRKVNNFQPGHFKITLPDIGLG